MCGETEDGQTKYRVARGHMGHTGAHGAHKAADFVAESAVAVPMTEAEEAAAEESADAVDPEKE